MRNLQKIKWICTLAIITGMANADVIIDNSEPIPSGDIYSIAVMPTTGDVIITSNVTNETGNPGYIVTPVVVGTGVVINGFTISPSTLFAGAEATVTWSTDNAQSCTDQHWRNALLRLP